MEKLDTRLIKNFEERNLSKHSLGWISDYRLTAINLVKEMGMPKLSDEDWRFTSLKDFSLKDFSPIFSSKSKFKKPSLPDYIDKIDGYFIYIHNGNLVSGTEYPFIVEPLEASFEFPEVKKVLLDDTLSKNKDFFYELGSAFIENGLYLKINKSQKIDKPIICLLYTSPSPRD